MDLDSPVNSSSYQGKPGSDIPGGASIRNKGYIPALLEERNDQWYLLTFTRLKVRNKPFFRPREFSNLTV